MVTTKHAPPLVLFEDDHLLAVNKPSGINTHQAAPYNSEGIYEWLRNREPHWASLAIAQRLDRDTSGVMIFGKTRTANQSLQHQFAGRSIRKTYHVLTDRKLERVPEKIVSVIAKISGGKFVSRTPPAAGQHAETQFRVVEQTATGTLIEARPVTGRTHQIRLHARDAGFPVLGDALYDGATAARLMLHATRLELRHPVTGKELVLTAEPEFESDAATALRRGFIVPDETNAFRLLHGGSDQSPGWYVEKLGDHLLSLAERPPTGASLQRLERWAADLKAKSVYHQHHDREARRTTREEASPTRVLGAQDVDRFEIKENGVRFEMSFNDGCSQGLFLDQRDNRRRLLRGHVAAGFPLFPRSPARPQMLNVFAYTCGFSVCAALAGMSTTSLDLSKKYLDWGRHNFELNDIDPEPHEFIFGDAFDWLKRLAKKGRLFDVIVLDPPTFSQSKQSGVFKVDKDFGGLVRLALPLLGAGGVLLSSSNAAGWSPHKFVEAVEKTVAQSGREITDSQFAPQPPDFPSSGEEKAYLKTYWTRVD